MATILQKSGLTLASRCTCHHEAQQHVIWDNGYNADIRKCYVCDCVAFEWL